MKLLKVIKQFERFNFHGVAEKPELSFERDTYTQFTERSTGRSVFTSPNPIDLSDAVIIGYIKDDFDKKEETFIAVK